jgi:hypothetical protein
LEISVVAQNLYFARSEDLVSEELGREILVYDKANDVAHSLSAVAALVWSTCVGGATLDQLVEAVRTTAPDEDPEGLTLTALAQLREKGLLQSGSTTDLVSRRDALRRMVKIGAVAASVPMIASATVKTPAAAASHGNGTGARGSRCTHQTQCGPGLFCTAGVHGGNGTQNGNMYCATSTSCVSGGTRSGSNCSTSDNCCARTSNASSGCASNYCA